MGFLGGSVVKNLPANAGDMGWEHPLEKEMVFSPAPQFKSINSSVPSLLYGPTLTSIHDHWKSHSFD